MQNGEVYGHVGAALVSDDDETHRRLALGLFMTAGIADRFARGELTEGEARVQIQSIIESGQIPDARVLADVATALNGSPLLSDPAPFATVDSLSTAFKVVGLFSPLFSPAAAVVAGLAAEFGAPFVKYIHDPNNLLTGQFMPPRPHAVRVAGAVALERLHRSIEQRAEVAEIYHATIPQTAQRLSIGRPVQELIERLPPTLAAPLLEALQASGAEFAAQIEGIEAAISSTLDELGAQTSEVLRILREEENERERAARLEHARRREERMNGEIAGAISIVDVLARRAFGDPRAAAIVVGGLRAAQSAHKLVSALSVGAVGVLGFAGGVATIVDGLLGLFGGGDDFVKQRVEQLERKLDQISDILVSGLEHIDRRIDQVLDVSRLILERLSQGLDVLESQTREINRRIESIAALVTSTVRDGHESAVGSAADRVAAALREGRSLAATEVDALNLFWHHAKRHSREDAMNGRLAAVDIPSLRDALKVARDVRHVLANLPYVARLAGVPIVDSDLPCVEHWSRSSHGIIEFLVHEPNVAAERAELLLQERWREGADIKAAVLKATSPDVLAASVDEYEATLLREMSHAGEPTTLDELAKQILEARVIGTLSDFVDRSCDLLTHQAFDVGTRLQFLASILAWRISEIGDELSVNPRAIDLVAEPSELASMIKRAVAAHTPEGQSPLATSGTEVKIEESIRVAALRELRKDMKAMLGRLRDLPRLGESRRVRDVDEVMLAVAAVARSRSAAGPYLALADLSLPLLRIPESARPSTIYEVSEHDFVTGVRGLCTAALGDFAAVAGEVFEASSGLARLRAGFLGFEGRVLPAGASTNPNGSRSYVRVFLTSPFNWDQARRQISRVEQWLLSAFPGLRAYELLLPSYVRVVEPATRRTEKTYMSRPLDHNGTPTEIALITREIAVPTGVHFANELWVFTRRSGAVIQ